MSGNPSRLALFFADLKRRGVIRLASIYAVVGLGINEAYDIIGGRFMVPDWSFNALIILTIVGFPVTMILGWIYDISSKGLVKTDPLTSSEKASIKLSWKPSWVSIILLFILLFTTTAFFIVPRPNAVGFKQQDWIIMADLENNTGDDVFDNVLLSALKISIDQSRRINIYPRTQVDKVLKRMKLDSVKRITLPIALEIAERENIKAVLLLSISELGGTYMLSSSLVNPYTGETIRSSQVTAEGKEEILSALDKLSMAVRKDLGDSLQEIHLRTVPLQKATTHSLEALKYFTIALRIEVDPYHERKIEMLGRAIELDPEFALAHSYIASFYYYTNQREKGEKHISIALSQLDRLTEYERLWIEAAVEGYRGNREASIRKFKVFLDKYPNTYGAWYRLGYNYMMLNKHEESIDAFKKVLNIYNDPEPGVLINIASNYNILDENERAIKYYREAFHLKPDYVLYSSIVHEYGYAYVKNGEMEKAVEVFNKLKDGDDDQVANCKRSTALMFMYQGKYAEALGLMHDAVILHRSMGYKLSEFRNRLYLCKIYQAKGMQEEFQAELDQCAAIVGDVASEPIWFVRVGVLLTRNGELEKAEALLEKIPAISNAGNKRDEAAYNVLKGEIELARGNLTGSLELLEAAVTLDDWGYNLESLAKYYMEVENWEKAIVICEQIINDKSALGWEAQECWLDAHFYLIKAYQKTGDVERANNAQKQIMKIWKEADEDLPRLVYFQVKP
ncbi:MAG: tetratricopeptide repeat protein [Bacteroidota bacterium]|nr:tetratricopeptide repeat protein [Bacteroidota bacterium]